MREGIKATLKLLQHPLHGLRINATGYQFQGQDYRSIAELHDGLERILGVSVATSPRWLTMAIEDMAGGKESELLPYYMAASGDPTLEPPTDITDNDYFYLSTLGLVSFLG
ncbi:hypothetical protein [Leptolyngbya sp. FACHB-17]|uniref:hypothetical protein n=1 Tax=unclassified Leptolyngbya TaxID=2650499 RepID=UPI00168040C2|nr:hypothetical protein [Leptolyngbya sp. FACHB-17]MBD2079316.1 hypothetical protein [Leptolyngbya sp. FACHB-17]